MSEAPVQSSIFNLPVGLQMRDRGIEKAIRHSETYIETARCVARILYRRLNRPISNDDIREVMLSYGIEPEHKNSHGGVFKNGEWEFVGWTPSKIPSNHGRPVRTWKLREGS